MKLLKVFFGITIGLSWCHRETETTLLERLTNRKQKKLIEGSMDLSADPCDDFYKYACGNWDQTFLEAGTKYYESITMLDYNVNQEMSKAFKRFRLRNKPNFIRQAHTYYKSCASLEKYEAINYLTWLKANDGFRWPALWTKPENRTQFDWVQMLAKMRTYGFNDVFIQQIVMSRISNANGFIIDLDKPVQEEGFTPMSNANFQILMESLPAQITTEEFDNLWQEIEEFEEKLKELDAIEDNEADEENDYEKTHKRFVKDLPLEWLKDYLRIVLNKTELNDEVQVYIQNIPYMKALDTLLKQHSQRFLCKYLEIRFLWYLHINGPSNFIDTDCTSSTRSLMPIAMHWQYEEYHPELVPEYSSLNAIFNEIRKHFNNTITKNKHGFNATIIEYLQNKINHMKLRLNNIPRTNTIATLENFYQSLDLHAEKFYENHLKLLRFNFLTRLNLLEGKKAVLDYTFLENTETGASSSPYFVQHANIVFLPLTLLQHPIYSPGLEDIYKYSSLGFLLAHEMFHGFDDTGLLSAADGSTVLIEFEDNPLFNASYNCLLEINPQVVSEKIADVSGLRYAYQAFFDHHTDASNKTTTLLYGKEVSLSQLFFLNFAQFFCGTSSVAEFVSMAEHGTDRDRVVDALSHFPEFAKEFKCNSKHRLYPHETCHLWR